NRDELTDGGAAHLAKTVQAVRQRLPLARIEVLTPDFKGNLEALRTVLASGPDTFNHNIETVARLYPLVRPQAVYEQSLAILASARRIAPSILTKSGFMVGLGEEPEEVHLLLRDLREHGVQVATIGQYLQPTRAHLPVAQYIHPTVFERYKACG